MEIVDAYHDREDEDEGSSSDSDYLSFDESDNEDNATKEDAAANKEARERERRLVLEAAGLILNNAGPPPVRTKSKGNYNRRPAPATPRPRPRRLLSVEKDLPPVPKHDDVPETELREAELDDAFARYESFKNNQANLNLNRLSVISTDSTTGSIMGTPTSPTTATSSTQMTSMSPTLSQASSRESEGGRYSHFFQFLTGSRTPDGEKERKSVSSLTISAPILSASNSHNGQGSSVNEVESSRANSPSFGTSWASLVDKNALEGIPPGERKRQEAIFELINTEMAYVRDLQLIAEVFHSSILKLLSSKEITVVFANIEDLLLVNTAFVSSLEDRQKECRLYVDKIGDILLFHLPNMTVYMEYCVNQANAIKVLQSLRESKPELASRLQQLRDENPTVRNLDLSSYLLAPMQRITRYPLLIKQILQYTEIGEEHEAIKTSRDMAEKLLAHINETIRDQEGHETLKRISQNLWIGQGKLDLTAPTKMMGPRKLIKEGILLKAKSGKKLQAFLCSDILVLVDDRMKSLYRMPIPLAHGQIKAVLRDDSAFQISQPYPRGGDSIALKALSARDCREWIQEVEYASKKARHAEEKASRKSDRL